MITRTPYDRDNLKIGKKDKVLEVGRDTALRFVQTCLWTYL